MNQLLAVFWDVDGTIANTELCGHRVAFNLAFKDFELDWYWDRSTYLDLLKVSGGKNRILYYAKANNLGLQRAKTKYALILNPDSRLSNNTLEKFFTATEKNSDFAMIGPKVVSHDLNQKTLKSGTLVILVFILISWQVISHIIVHPGETLLEIFLGGKSLAILSVKVM